MSDFCTECGLPVPSNATACKNGHQYHRNAVPGTKVQPPAGMPPIFPPPVRQPPTTPPTGMPVTPSRLPKTAATNPSQTFGAMIRQYPGTKQPKRFDIGFRMKCPFCNFEFHPNDCAVYSTVRSNQNGEKLLLRQAPVFHTLARLRRIPLEGPLFTQNAACRQCPRCENFLPYRFELDASFNIAMVGDAFSGKSHYLAALLHQLMSNEIAQQENIRVRLSPMNDLAKSKWKEFQETLFERHGLLPGNIRFNPATEKEIQGNYSIREPLIFRLEIGYLAESVSSVINLVFYDMSGEDIADENVMALYGWPILEAQAIIYFVDSLNMERVLQELPDDHPQVQAARDFIHNPARTKPHIILERIVPLFRRYNRLNHEGKINTPTAIVLSKSDVLDTIAKKSGFERARFLQRSASNGTVDVDDMRMVDDHMQIFLKQFGELGLVQDRNFYFNNASFFATSATGCAPDNGQYKDIRPRRCLDPLLWLLLKLTESNYLAPFRF